MARIMKKLSVAGILKFIFLTGIVVMFLYPFLHMVAVSFSSLGYVLRNDVNLIPRGFTTVAYQYVLNDPRILRAYLNTIILVSTGTVVSLAVTAMGAYALAQPKLVWRTFFTWMLIIPLFFDGGLIPTFLVVRAYGLLDTIWAVILPFTVNIINLVILRTFFQGIPSELQEAAKIDGLNDIGIFLRIILPLSKPGLAAIGLFYGVAYWNTYVAPMIYISSPDRHPLQVVLYQMLVLNEGFGGDVSRMGTVVSDTALRYTTIIVSLIPVVIIYPLLQKYFVKGIMLGSIKG